MGKSSRIAPRSQKGNPIFAVGTKLADTTRSETMNDVSAETEGLTIPVIDRFRGEHFFLSNFYPAPTPYRGVEFPTSEHAFAAARTTDHDAITAILATPDPAEAKQKARAAPLVDDWDTLRFAAMEEIVTAKFTHNAELGDKLVATAGAILIEGNTWHDQTWGSCTCDEHRQVSGGNALGAILMVVRMRLAANHFRGH